MNILWLCLAAFALVLAGWFYLSKDIYSDHKTNIVNGTKIIFKEHKLRWIYLLSTWLILCAMVVWLHFIYPSNSFMLNLKLITLLAILFVVNVSDVRMHIIPNKVILAAIVLRLVYYVAEVFTLGSGFWTLLKGDLSALLIVAFLFVVGVLIIKNGLGMGDIKLMLVMCLFQGVTGVIGSLFFSLIVAFFVSITMLIMKKKTRKDSLAFAPSILLGTLISVFLSGI